jgi:apolipoprotein N-acyltransferase
MLVNTLLSLLSAVLLILTFPNAGIVYLAPFALAPLLTALGREPRWRVRFLLAHFFGSVYWFGVCYWIQFVLEQHGAMGVFGSWACMFVFATGKALHFGVFGVLCGMLLNRTWALPAVAALWTAVEGAPQILGFTWLALGNAGIDMSLPLRLAPLAGVHGLTFVFALLNAAVAAVALRRPRKELLWLALLGVLYVLPAISESHLQRETAVLVQPNVSMDQNWNVAAWARFKDRMLELSARRAGPGRNFQPRLIIWPEVPAPVYFYRDLSLRFRLVEFARKADAHILLGTVAHNKEGAPLNSAVMLLPSGKPGGRYDKINLVPFGEYVPELFSFVHRITQEAGDFAPGAEVKLLPVDGHKAGVFICYESVFPNLVRQFAAQGAELFVNISNDGYFGRSAALRQHLLMVRMRAVENRRWILRATNDGYTVNVDPSGRIAASAPPFTETTLAAPYAYISDTTVYTRFGNWFLLACAFGAFLALIATQIPIYNPRTPEIRRS